MDVCGTIYSISLTSSCIQGRWRILINGYISYNIALLYTFMEGKLSLVLRVLSVVVSIILS